MKDHKYIPLNQISVPAYSSKKSDSFKLGKLKKVLKKYGQILPIQVRLLKKDSYELITGRKILHCLESLDTQSIYCYNHGKISSEQAKLIYLETDLQNYETDTVGLAEIIEDVVGHYGIYDVLETVPFTQNEINGYLKYLSFDWEELRQDDEARRLKKGKPQIEITLKKEVDMQQIINQLYK